MTITVDQVGAAGVNGTTTGTLSMTLGGTANYIVALVIFSNTDTSSGVTWNGTSMTLLQRYTFAGPALVHEYWALQAPTTGTANLICTKSGGTNYSFARLCGVSYNNMRQTYSLDGTNSNTQSSTTPSISATDTFGDSAGIMICESATTGAGTPSPGTVISPSGLIIKKALNAGAYTNIFTTSGSQTMSYPSSVTNAYNSIIILNGLVPSATKPSNRTLLGVG